jgi:outer membrane lipoprotein-sorting protein
MKKGLPPIVKLLQGSVAVCLLFGGSVAVLGQQAPLAVPEGTKVANIQVAAATEHPLIPVIRWAERERPNIAAIKDYTATMQKQESIGGEQQEAQVMEIKIRHEPFGAYLKFRYPKKMNGQEAIWVPSQNNGKLVGHGVGLEKKFGTQFLDPEGFIAMRGNKYSIKEMGLLNLVDKLLEVGRKDSKFGECEVTYTEDVKVADRECTLIQVTHPIPRKNFIFYVARIYVDKELNLPIRYEAYDWPQKEGEKPMLIEAYTYLNLKINVGLTDADFDYKNPAYGYPQ